MAAPSTLRQDRERDLVRATRALFDERGMLHAPIEEIAQAAGIARGLIYRQFASKEELFVLTVTDYLDELEGVLEAAMPAQDEPVAGLERAMTAYAEFCRRYPAFLDSSLSLMRRPAEDLHAAVSESVWLRLGQRMGACIDHLVRLLRAGAQSGAFEVEDPELAASILWTQVLGSMHLARVGVGLRQATPGIPALFRLSGERVVEMSVASALATVRAVRR